jgi:phosphotransferase system HPr (HPr) family protein
MYKKTVTISNKSGLHARPASLFVEHAKNFSSEVFVAKPGSIQVNAKSILGILSLGVNKGSTIEISAQGPDAEEAVNELVKFIETFNADS